MLKKEVFSFFFWPSYDAGVSPSSHTPLHLAEGEKREKKRCGTIPQQWKLRERVSEGGEEKPQLSNSILHKSQATVFSLFLSFLSHDFFFENWRISPPSSKGDCGNRVCVSQTPLFLPAIPLHLRWRRYTAPGFSRKAPFPLSPLSSLLCFPPIHSPLYFPLPPLLTSHQRRREIDRCEHAHECF